MSENNAPAFEHRSAAARATRANSGAPTAPEPAQSVPLPPRARESLRDEELLAFVQQGNEHALGVLYDRYIRLVYTIALRITGDRQTAEEVVQDTFHGVWQTAANFHPDTGTCSAWLLGIARHRAIDTMRSRRERARGREHTIDVTAAIFAEDSHPERHATHTVVREAIQAALQTLPENQRQPIELAYYGGLTRVEIAVKLGEPLGTIKTRLRLGMCKLREALQPFDDA